MNRVGWQRVRPWILLVACNTSEGHYPYPRAQGQTPLAAWDARPVAADAAPIPDAGAELDAADAATREADAEPSELHLDTKEELLRLIPLKNFSEDERKRIGPDRFLDRLIGTSDAWHMNQGNKAIASHLIGREQCLQGLKDVVLQTDAQKTACGENMVPIHMPGKEPYFCIDIFEYPNKACELPFVWISPSNAERLCQLQNKRLCSQIEWDMSCRGDPDNGKDSKYAYGDKLDLTVCNTQRPHTRACNPFGSDTAFATCTTLTEPSGGFPKCRSRFGVFDQHGNVAEIMKRREGDKVFSQLKGSAFFYTVLAREPGEAPKMSQRGMETYPDHCNFDPRWHVEPIENAWHVNYHLGFRCCKNIP
jgi:formylglycine-generating enzyme